MNQMKTQGGQTEINDKYKSERCRHFETHKNCALGDKCHFAHGDEELRKPGDQMNPEIIAKALKSQQWQNCNQQNNMRFMKTRGDPNPQGSMRGGMKPNGMGRGG
jgi:hypothetical protein